MIFQNDNPHFCIAFKNQLNAILLHWFGSGGPTGILGRMTQHSGLLPAGVLKASIYEEEVNTGK